MSTTNLSELLKIPLSQQTSESLKLLQNRRKELADLFYHKNDQGQFDTIYDKKIEIFDELESLHKYFDFKLPKKPWKSNTGKSYVTSKEQRITNCNNLREFLVSIGTWDSLSPFEHGTILAKVWGSVKA